MIEADRQMQEEILKLTKDNNHMLHSMRRTAFWTGLLKFFFYIGAFVVVPVWLYSTYLAPVIQSMNDAVSQVQGTGASAQAQFASFQKMMSDLQKKLPAFMQTK